MAEPDPTTASHTWPLRGSWLAWFRFSVLVSALLILGAAGLVIAGGRSDGQGRAALLVVGAIVLAVGGLIAWQLLHTALAVTLAADGTLTVRRLRGALHTRVERVERVRPSVLRSGRTPVVISAADGSALLIHPRHDVEEMIAALRRHRPDLAVEV